MKSNENMILAVMYVIKEIAIKLVVMEPLPVS